MTARRLLLVDDEPLLLQALARLLRAAGWEVLTARSSTEAEALLTSRGPVAAVLCDEGLEGESGLAWLQRLAERQSGLARILLTGRADLAAPEGTLHGRVEKPWHTPSLLTLLENVVRRKD